MDNGENEQRNLFEYVNCFVFMRFCNPRCGRRQNPVGRRL